MIIYKRKKKQLVIPCGLGPVVCPETGYELQAKTVDSSTNQFTVTPDASFDGLSQVIVNGVTAAIDPDIQAGNIKKDVEILGVTGTFEGGSLGTKTINSSTVQQTVTPDANDYGLSSVTVNPYRATGAIVDPCINKRIYIPGFYNYDAWSQFTVNAVTSAIDPDIQPENIKKDVEILGVTGTFEGGSLGTKTINSSTVQQTVTPDASDYGLSSVTVNPYTLESDSSVITQNGQYVFTPQNADGLSQVTVDVSANIANIQDNASLSIDGLWFKGPEFIIGPLKGYDAMSTVKVRADLGSVTIQPSSTNDSGAYISSYPHLYGFHTVNVRRVTSAIDSNIQPENIKDGVTILGVEGNYSGTATDPWYVKAKKGQISDVSAYSLDEFASYTYGNACLLASTGITTCPQLNSSTLDASNLFGTFSECKSFDASAKFNASITNIGNYAFSNTFKSSNIKDVSIYIADNLNDKSFIFQDTFASADIGDVYIKVNGIVDYDEHSNPIYGMKGALQPFNNAFNNAGASNIAGNVTIDVPNCVSTNGALANAFYECYLNSVTITTSRLSKSKLRNFMYYTFRSAYINNLSIPNLSEGNNYLFEYTCSGAHIKNLNVHPYVLSVYNDFDEQSKFAYNADILNVTLTADATDNIYLEYCRKLSAEGVLNILSHLDLTVSGKGVYFYSNGLTVTDYQDGRIQAAYNDAVAAGWTINNLTINPYS